MVITCTSPSKTFNLAGLQISNIFISNDILRKKMREELEKTGYTNPSQVGIVACEAGYRYGADWFCQLKTYLQKNFEYVDHFLKEKMPQVTFSQPEGTYLAWIDCKGLGIPENELESRILKEAGLWLDEGKMFGSGGNFFERINIACPKENLKNALESFYKLI